MAQEAHYHNNDLHQNDAAGAHPGKGHASKEKFMGGIKETLGTVLHAEGMKESGREQKREGDAEALAAGKGKKHYDPALARKGVGIQHKHMGPNPKKITEGPCAGCKDGTCQIGHDYDAAVCHSCTQGHSAAGHVHNAGMPINNSRLHEGHAAPIQHSHHSGGLIHNTSSRSAACSTCNNSTCHGCSTTTNFLPGHNMAYNAALCPECSAGTCQVAGHSARDKERIKTMKTKRSAEEKEIRRREKAERAKHAHSHTSHDTHSHATHSHATHSSNIGHTHPGNHPYTSASRAPSDFNRDLDAEHAQNTRLVSQLDMEDRKDQARLHGKLKNCPTKHHLEHTQRGVFVCDTCGQRLD